MTLDNLSILATVADDASTVDVSRSPKPVYTGVMWSAEEDRYIFQLVDRSIDEVRRARRANEREARVMLPWKKISDVWNVTCDVTSFKPRSSHSLRNRFLRIKYGQVCDSKKNRCVACGEMRKGHTCKNK
jgi:hypothetical protein